MHDLYGIRRRNLADGDLVTYISYAVINLSIIHYSYCLLLAAYHPTNKSMVNRKFMVNGEILLISIYNISRVEIQTRSNVHILK